MATIHIRHCWTGKIIHTVAVNHASPLFPLDLRGANLMNADLSCASLPDANLEGAVLLGCKLIEADLRRANLRGCDLRYTDLAGCDLTEADLRDTETYPANVSRKTKLFGAKISPGSETHTLQIEVLHETRRKAFGNNEMCRVRPAHSFKDRMQAAKVRSDFLCDEMESNP